MSYLVYPGATHKRFEHSLGVMELAGRVFDVVTGPDNIHESFRKTVLNFTEDEKTYWRKVLRMAALCHDIGHLPFSHAAETELLPRGRSHESITVDLILGDLMAEIWNSMTPPLRPLDIAKVSVGQKYIPGEEFADWEKLLYEIIGGDALGVDRADYLLRDSHHAGVAYGRFDHYRLIESMRILPASGGPTRLRSVSSLVASTRPRPCYWPDTSCSCRCTIIMSEWLTICIWRSSSEIGFQEDYSRKTGTA